MSVAYQVGPSWKGFSAIRYLITFGASYCDVGYAHFRDSIPSASKPLGIDFPGTTYNEEGLPNWVGHLITKYSPPPRFNPSLGEEQDPKYKESPLLVYNYAMGGQTVDGVRRQVETMFLSSLGRDFGSSWNATNALFMTWVGINDCGLHADPHTANETLFATQETLYNAGARHFLLIDVPPIHRSPAVRPRQEKESSEVYLQWNRVLRESLERFSKKHTDASVFLFSSFELFTKILDNPHEYGFPDADIRKVGGEIWIDMIHPTSKDLLAQALLCPQLMLRILRAAIDNLRAPTAVSSVEMSKVYRSGTNWPGFPGLRSNSGVSGDSYSDVGYSTYLRRVAPPDVSNPLGIKFPGITFNEDGLPNWVGHLITKYTPGPRFDPSREEQDPQFKESPLLVFNYATGGRTVEGVKYQVDTMFIPSMGQNTSWNASNSLFVTWVGINDCGMRRDPSKAITTLMSTQEVLYEAGARNFLFVDVPPVHRSPATPKDAEEKSASNIQNWNDTLRRALETFTESHEDTSVFLFSSFEVFENVLNDPNDYGFQQKDVRKARGAIWVDHLHPTSKMHDVIASSFAAFLNQI